MMRSARSAGLVAASLILSIPAFGQGNTGISVLDAATNSPDIAPGSIFIVKLGSVNIGAGYVAASLPLPAALRQWPSGAIECQVNFGSKYRLRIRPRPNRLGLAGTIQIENRSGPGMKLAEPGSYLNTAVSRRYCS